MKTEFLSLSESQSRQDVMRRAAKALAEGAIVAFPTETVYGVGASAASDDSVRRLREVKGRESKQPFTVHIGRRGDCDEYVPNMPALGRRFVRKGWPGPLTLLFEVADPRKAKIHARLSREGVEAVYREHNVGLRLPDHAAAAAILIEAGVPVIASSANVTGAPAPTTAQEVREQLDGKVDLILDGGRTRYKRGSTIVAVNGEGYHLVRAGVFDERTVKRLGQVAVLFVCSGNTCRSPMAEALFRRMAAKRLGCRESDLADRGVRVESAGTSASIGAEASEKAVAVCKRRGLDLSAHSSRGLTVDQILAADYIFTMGLSHLEAVLALSPEAACKAARLDPDQDIADPAGGTTEDYEHAVHRIASALEGRIDEVPL